MRATLRDPRCRVAEHAADNLPTTMSPVAAYVIICLSVLIGAFVQGGIGLGVGLVGSPVAAIVDPSVMPVAILFAAVVLPLLTLATEWRHVDVRGAGIALAGRVCGTLVAVWLLAGLPPRPLGIAVGVMVLLAVGLSFSRLRIAATPATLAGAGAIAGVTGTTTSIGGPPLALVYQDAPGPRIRATLALFFSAGNAVSLSLLGATGHITGHDVAVGLACVPCAAAGFLLAAPFRRYLDRGRTKGFVLAVVALAGAALLVKNLG